MPRLEFWLIGMAVIALFVVGRDAIEQYRDISETRHQVGQAVVALQATENVTSLLLKAETAQRGYLLTGSVAYVQPYRTVVHEMPAALDDFEKATRSIMVDPSLAAQVRPLIRAKLNETSKTIELYHSQGPAKALELVETNVGKQLMDEFTAVSRRIQGQCVNVFTRDSQDLEKKARYGAFAAATGIGIVLVVLALAAIRLQRSFKRSRKLVEQLSEAGEQYQLLVRRLESVREEERAHLAREIHDALGQSLTIIKLDIALALRQMAGKPELAPAREKLHQANATVDKMIQVLRRVASELRPPLLDASGLCAALYEYTRQLTERTGLNIRIREEGELPALTPDQRIAAFRICQESLTNVIRHASATDATIHLLPDEDLVRIVIADNGVGFSSDGAHARQSLGLLGMQERARLVDGELSIESSAEKGTTIALQIPIRR